MSDPKDGGAAFPLAMPSDKFVRVSDGMSLRDYFAGQALAGLCAAGWAVHINEIPMTHEKAAYVLADAMLKERAK